MAKFYLENEYATQIDLQDDDNYCIATDVSGLGVAFDSDYIAVGDRFVRNYLNPTMTELSLNLCFFMPDVYDKIQTVANFLMAATSLYLVYRPDISSGVEYRREVEIKSYLKNGVRSGFICYTLKLAPLSLFYYKKQTRFEITEMEDDKRYEFAWDANYNDYSDRSLVVSGGNHVEIAFDLEIDGYAENPMMEIYDDSDNLIFSLQFPFILQEGQKILYSSRDENILIQLQDVDGSITSLFSEFDLEANLFFKIPQSGGTVRFVSDTDSMNTIIFTAYFFFKVV